MRLLLLTLLLAPLVAALGGCDEGVDPTLGTEQAFTVWGYLDPAADQQAIRVVAITDEIDANPAVIDAVVTATDLASAEVVTFRDSLVTFEDGATGHVFVADWTPQFDRTYRLDVTRTSDGETATAEVRVPIRVEGSVGEANSTLEDVTYPFAFGAAPNVFGVRIDLYVTGLPEAPQDTSRLEVPFPAGRGEQGQIEIAFVSTVRRFLADAGLASQGLSLVHAELAAFVANEEWDVPTGRFDDREEIVEPGTISNVTGGFGFVGAGYFTRTRWTPSVRTQIRAGFGSSEDSASRLWINEMSVEENWVELYNPLDEDVAIGGYSFSNAPSEGPLTILSAGTRVPARGFLVVELENFELQPATTLFFISGASRLVLERNIEDAPTGLSFGSYPDGRRLNVRVTPIVVQDFMGGDLRPSPGAPNIPAPQLVFLNEVYTEADGWAEILVREPVREGPVVRGVWVLTDEAYMRNMQTLRSYPQVADLPTQGLATMDEDEQDGLALPQAGAEVYVLVAYAINSDPGAETLYRVMDYQRLGLQAPGESEGRLPDAGPWSGGLAPTRGASNASARPL